MKVACFADLHMEYELHPNLETVKKLSKECMADVVVIAGDIFDNVHLNPYKQLARIGDIPIICCLGNHEFAYSSIDRTLETYREKYNPDRYNVHYLDVIGKFEVGKLNFVGNVLWYDGSLRDIGPDTDIVEFGWLDSTINDFRFKEENAKCVAQIEHGLSAEKENFLVTHCVPHRDLNLFSLEFPSIYNTYSGVDNLFTKLSKRVQYAICGHTHRHIAKEIGGCFCVNIGNDYMRKGNGFQYFVMEVDE